MRVFHVDLSMWYWSISELDSLSLPFWSRFKPNFGLNDLQVGFEFGSLLIAECKRKIDSLNHKREENTYYGNLLGKLLQ